MWKPPTTHLETDYQLSRGLPAGRKCEGSAIQSAQSTHFVGHDQQQHRQLAQGAIARLPLARAKQIIPSQRNSLLQHQQIGNLLTS
jgi:lipid-binding SYLF domain-containing protein